MTPIGIESAGFDSASEQAPVFNSALRNKLQPIVFRLGGEAFK